MGIGFEVDPANPVRTIDDIIPQIELLADTFGFSADNSVLSEGSLTALTDTMGAMAIALKETRDALRGRPPLSLKVV